MNKLDHVRVCRAKSLFLCDAKIKRNRLNKKVSEKRWWYVSAHEPQCALVLLDLITPNTHTYLVGCSEKPIRRAGQVTG